jgi:ADP-ribose pyrophosphatase YjhB (NUDIX family)
MEFKNPGITADLIVENEKGEILLIKRKNYPFAGKWALPGGFLEYGKETLEECGVRELEEETHLITNANSLELVGVYSNPKRDPRGHTIAGVYAVLKHSGEAYPGDDAGEVGWFPKKSLYNLAFDHDEILKDYFRWKGSRLI